MSVIRGSGMQPGEIGTDQPYLAGPVARNAREPQVASGRDLPRDVGHLPEVAKPAARLRLDSCREASAQGERLECGHAHTLAVDRVEVAQRVTVTSGPREHGAVVRSGGGRWRGSGRRPVVQRLGLAYRLPVSGNRSDRDATKASGSVGGWSPRIPASVTSTDRLRVSAWRRSADARVSRHEHRQVPVGARADSRYVRVA